MSLIIHRCQECEHPDIFHNGSNCCAGHCRLHVPVYREPEVMQTKLMHGKAVVEEIAQPGTKFTGFGALPLDLCGCDQCVALYNELTGASA